LVNGSADLGASWNRPIVLPFVVVRMIQFLNFRVLWKDNCKGFFFFFLSVCFVFRDRVSLCSLGCPGTHSIDQAGLELRNPPASASQVLGLKVCATTPSLRFLLLFKKKKKTFLMFDINPQL
jgi:hypothetical protein